MTITEKLVVLVFLAIIVAVYTAEIFLVFTFVVNKLQAKEAANIFWCRPALLIHLLAITGVMCILYGYFIEPYWLEVKTIEIKTEKLSKNGLRLIHITDLHCDKKLKNEKKMVELINGMEPDIIVFTGDAINTSDGLALFKETMKELKANLAKYAVRGNIDVRHWSGLDLFGGTGFELLDANSVKLQKDGETFYISGLSCGYSSEFQNVLKDIPDNCFSILLYHYPYLIEDLGNLNVDLYLAGHTHGGQIALPIYGPLITLSKFGKKYEAGMYTVGNTILYVNRGIGLDGGIAPRVRFLTRPEITVFEIKPK